MLVLFSVGVILIIVGWVSEKAQKRSNDKWWDEEIARSRQEFMEARPWIIWSEDGHAIGFNEEWHGRPLISPKRPERRR